MVKGDFEILAGQQQIDFYILAKVNKNHLNTPGFLHLLYLMCDLNCFPSIEFPIDESDPEDVGFLLETPVAGKLSLPNQHRLHEALTELVTEVPDEYLNILFIPYQTYSKTYLPIGRFEPIFKLY